MATIFFDRLTKDEREAFIEGFKHMDVIGIDDTDSDKPWTRPWLWEYSMEACSDSPFRWGQQWFAQNFHQILAWHYSKETSKRE